MSVRTRLILAFLALSVVPLSAVTLYSYSSSVGAFRAAVASESERMAADLQQRLDTVTADLGRQVGLLWEPSVATAATRENDANPPVDVNVVERVAAVLGDSARLLERVEITPLPEQKPPSTPPNAPADVPAPPAVPPAVPRPPLPPAVVIDLREAMDEVEKELAAEGVPPEVREQLKKLGENLGPAIRAGLQIAASATRSATTAASEALRQRTLAQQERARKLAEAGLPAALEGDALAVPVVRDGELVGSINAQLNLPRTLATVLSSAQTSQGEIPFAIDDAGTVHTISADHERALAPLNVAALRGSGVHERGDWVIVTRQAPSDVTFGIARPIAQSLREIQNASMRSLLLGLGVIGLAVLGIVPLAKHMTRDLTTLNEGVQRIAKGDFSAQVPVRSRDEFGALAAAFNGMARDVAHHQTLVVERERLRRELELCRRIQSEMLPHASLRLGPTEVKGISIPAREVGGDFFNYFELPGGEIAVLVGDVSGKGISAALLMANIQASLRTRLGLGQDLSAIADAIDFDIERNSPGPVYATLFVGILDPVTRRFRYVNAGHHPQFIVRHDGSLDRMPSTGLPVGLLAGRGYDENTLQVSAGDVIFFYTDGCVEMENDADDMFGTERLEALLTSAPAGSAEDILGRVESAVKSFRGSREPFDDATMMAVRVG